MSQLLYFLYHSLLDSAVVYAFCHFIVQLVSLSLASVPCVSIPGRLAETVPASFSHLWYLHIHHSCSGLLFFFL